MIEVFVIFAMIFMHVIADFAMQGVMADMKQKEWWKKNAPDAKYDGDFIMPLLMHSFSWAFLVMLPLAGYAAYYYGGIGITYFALLIINTNVHLWIDHAKCNEHKINLIQDQAIHLGQILITAAVMMAM